ncbi:restriction endonuclease subunit S [Acinetobacter johnsonii]|uniref:restriction endonuclease subunit S n=1 Tax=Acinetobacter johnsonii TaxID=40214 RepID=UPI00398CC84E
MAMIQEPIKIVHADECMDVRDGTHDSPQSVQTGIPLVTSKNLVNGKIDFSTCNFISEEDHEAISKRSKVDDGDILYAMIGTIGNPVIVSKDCDFSIKNVALFKFNNADVYNRYIYHFLNSEIAKKQLTKLSRGGTQKFVSLGNLRKLKIPLPPLAEQRRIASILDQADELRQKRQQAIEKLDQLLQATFIDMFGDPVSNPKGWDVKKLENLTTKIGSGSTPKGGDSAYKDEGISLVRSLNIYDGQFSYKNLAFIDQDQADKLKNVILQANDVLLNITGASVARCCLVPNEVLPARVNQHVSILRVKDNLIPEFLEALLISKPMKLHLLKISGAGATREALTKLQLQELEIIVPPLDIQNEFLLKLESIKCLIDLNSKQLNELDKLFISSQNQAFNGSL